MEIYEVQFSKKIIEIINRECNEGQDGFALESLHIILSHCYVGRHLKNDSVIDLRVWQLVNFFSNQNDMIWCKIDNAGEVIQRTNIFYKKHNYKGSLQEYIQECILYFLISMPFPWGSEIDENRVEKYKIHYNNFLSKLEALMGMN